jgi:hypothetical protein
MMCDLPQVPVEGCSHSLLLAILGLILEVRTTDLFLSC